MPPTHFSILIVQRGTMTVLPEVVMLPIVLGVPTIALRSLIIVVIAIFSDSSSSVRGPLAFQVVRDAEK
jgi:hypothetical protein